MNYYINERKIDASGRTAWSKAREDAEKICADEGFAEIPVRPELADRVNAGFAGKLRGHFHAGGVWKKALAGLGRGDVLLLQVPVVHNCLALTGLLRKARRRDVRIIGLVHDLETLRMSIDGNVRLRSRLRMQMEESGVLKQCDRLIVHNEKMRELMASQGTPREKMISLGIFDYLVDPAAAEAVARREISARRESLIVAGNLSPGKAGYIYALPDGTALELYGVHFAQTARDNLHYHGAFAPGKLPAVLDGGFGLVWDGPVQETCAGVYGAYLRYNNPHKTSLYLAAGLPVAIWEEAALADLILAEGVGITAGSVSEAAEKAAAMTPEEYETCFRNAARLGEKLRRGDCLRRALREGVGNE